MSRGAQKFWGFLGLRDSGAFDSSPTLRNSGPAFPMFPPSLNNVVLELLLLDPLQQ